MRHSIGAPSTFFGTTANRSRGYLPLNSAWAVLVHSGGLGVVAVVDAPLEPVARISVPADPGASALGGLAGVTGDAIAPLADTVRFGVGAAAVDAVVGWRTCEAGTKSSSSESDESESEESDGGGGLSVADWAPCGLRMFCGTAGGT